MDPSAEVGEPDVFASTAAATIVMKEYIVRRIHMKSCTNMEQCEENQKLALLRGYREFEAFGTKCRVTAWGKRNNIQELLNNDKSGVHPSGGAVNDLFLISFDPYWQCVLLQHAKCG